MDIVLVKNELKQSLDVDALKHKAIIKYNLFLLEIKKGYKPSYTDIMNLICYISLPTRLPNSEFIEQLLINKQ